MDFDDILEHLGKSGRFQRKIFVINAAMLFTVPMIMLSQVFTCADVQHTCEASVQQYSMDDISNNLTLNNAYRHTSECFIRYYKTALNNISQYNISTGYNTAELQNGTSIADTSTCSKWTYSTQYYVSTTVTEWDLVCDDKWLKQLAFSILYLGMLVGAPTLGSISDRHGRLVTIYVSLFLQSLFGFLTALSPNLIVFLVCQFVVGFAVPGILLTAYAYGIEWTHPAKRATVGNMLAVSCAMGHMTLSLIAYFIRDWRILQTTISILPALLCLLYPLRVLPESPRWLLSHGHVNEMNVIIQRAAAANKKHLPNSFFYSCRQLHQVSTAEKIKSNGNDGRKYNVLDLCRTRKLRLVTINTMYNWLAVTVAYYGLSILSTSMAGNPYVNFCLSGLVEIPAMLAPIYVLNRWGRVKPIFAFCMVCAVACFIATIPVGGEFSYFITAVAMVGKFTAAAGFWSIYIHTSEMYPTVVRNIGIGVCCSCARIGTIVLPYTFLLTDIFEPFPYIFIGVIICSSGILVLFLPETVNKTLPSTIEEFEQTDWTSREPVKKVVKTLSTSEKYLAENIVWKSDYNPGGGPTSSV